MEAKGLVDAELVGDYMISSQILISPLWRSLSSLTYALRNQFLHIFTFPAFAFQHNH